jgi:hypothetical protein
LEYTIRRYQTANLVELKEIPGVAAWFDTRFELVEKPKVFKIVKWEDWCEAIRLRIKEELSRDEAVAEIDLEDLMYGPALNPDDPSPFCKYHMFHNIYENYVFVEDHKQKDCWWYINGDGTSLIYKPQLA